MRHTVAAVLLLLTACTSWRVQPVGPAQLISEHHPSRVRLRGQDGHQVVVRQPFVRGDSVLGLAQQDTTGLPMDEIHTVAVERFDWLKSGGLAVLYFGAAVGVVYVATFDSWGY
jgi:hypothetical protein